MKVREALAAIQVCLFLLGAAWLDRTFDAYREHVPTFVAEYHKPDHLAPSLEDGEQDVVNLTVPQLPRVPLPFMAGGNQFVEQEPSWILGTAPHHRFGTPWLRSPATIIPA
jgi:hypothetical protein